MLAEIEATVLMFEIFVPTVSTLAIICMYISELLHLNHLLQFLLLKLLLKSLATFCTSLIFVATVFTKLCL